MGLSALSLAVSLNAIAISDALATTGCVVSGRQVNCYDASGRQVASYDTYGHPTSVQSDGSIKIGNSGLVSYDASTNSVTRQDSYIRETNTYSSNGSLVQNTTSLKGGDTTTTSYNSSGQKTQVQTQTQSGITRTDTYSNGTRTSSTATNGNGSPVTGSYTSGNTTYNYNNGNLTSYSTSSSYCSGYWSNGKCTNTQTNTQEYSVNDRLIKSSTTQTNQNGVTTYGNEVNYNGNGQRTSETTTYRNSNGQITSNSEYTYENGKKTSGTSTSRDSNGNYITTDYTYNQYGSQIGNTKTYKDANGNALTGSYKVGNNTYNLTENGTVTGYTYAYSGSCYTSGPNGCQSGSEVTNYDGSGKLINSVKTDMNGNQKVTANGQTTYLDASGNPLSGTYIEGNYAYNYQNGVRTGYSYASSNNITEYDAQGRPISSTSCSSRVTNNRTCNNVSSTTEYERDEQGRLISETYEDRYGNGHEYEYDESGRPTDTVWYSNGDVWGYSNVYDSNGNYIGYEGYGGTRDEDGLLYISGIGVDGERIGYIKDKNGRILAKSTCSNSYSGRSDNAYAEGDCITEFYDSEGRVMSEYDQSANPAAAFLYDGDIVAEYDDQCMVKNLYDSDGNLLPAAIGDNLYNEKRKKRYTPSEASQIVQNSNDNSLILYYK